MPNRDGVSTVTTELTAAVITISNGDPYALTVTRGDSAVDALPSGPLQPSHKTLQSGLRSWVERQTQMTLGHVEQLYTFGDRATPSGPLPGQRGISIAYLALVSSPQDTALTKPGWHPWYDFFPWEDRRDGEAGELLKIRRRLKDWSKEVNGAERRDRTERTALSFGEAGMAWDEERALERYELLYEAGLVPEAWLDSAHSTPDNLNIISGRPMFADHRRILATAIGRIRAKIKYRPVLFELMPPAFTLLQLQQTAEALSGITLHKQNFRRLVTQQGLVEETGDIVTATGGRPARLMQFRKEVLLERPAPGVRVGTGRRTK